MWKAFADAGQIIDKWLLWAQSTIRQLRDQPFARFRGKRLLIAHPGGQRTDTLVKREWRVSQAATTQL